LAFRRFGVSSRAFTLIEMMIVVGIIVLLAAIVLPAAFSLLADSRVKQTKSTMNVLASAIEQFSAKKPLVFLGQKYGLRENPLNPPQIDFYLAIFGNFPPSPTAAFAPDCAALNVYMYQLASGQPPYPATYEEGPQVSVVKETNQKFLRLLNVIKGVEPLDCSTGTPQVVWRIWTDPPATWSPEKEKYASIECLLFTLREFCPDARKTVDSLQSAGTLVNLDKDFAYGDNTTVGSANVADANEPRVDLFEVLDAWKRPMRYAIREALRDPANPAAGAQFKWELRSAGEDGLFAPPLSAEDASDDVILQGP